MVNRGNPRDFCLTVFQKSHGLIPMSSTVTVKAVQWFNAHTVIKADREAFNDRFMLNAIQAYILIADRNSKDDRFFKQWVVRVEDDE
jgi:hypothetical protein